MFSKFFIERPIFATVVSMVLVIAGLVAMRALPVEQFPTITPVQIQVTTTYPGADSKTVGDSVAAPIEAQINGVDNMLYMTSTSSNTGQMTITVYFTLDTDPDIAQVWVQNRVALAMPQLPEAVVQYGVSTQKKSSAILMIISVFNKDGRYTPEYVTNYANVYILDAIKRVNGAGQANIFGVPDQAMRIWTNPDRMASLAITTTDIQTAIARQNALFGAGQVGQQPSDAGVQLTFPVVSQGPFVKPTRTSFSGRTRTGAPSFASRTSRAPRSAGGSTSTTTSSTARPRPRSWSISSRAPMASRCRPRSGRPWRI